MALSCTYCHRSFSYTGYTIHGQHASNQGCTDAYHKAILDQMLDDVESLSDTVTNSSHHGTPPPEDIDAFDEEQLYYPPNIDGEFAPDIPDIDVHSESDTDRSDVDTYSDTDSDYSDADDLEAGIQRWPPEDVLNEPHFLDERNGPQHENFIVKFESNRAGAPVDDHGIPTNVQYQNDVNNPDDNLYAPFTSKIDWEFARWAKLRGTSETAVTDLLSIDGVCANSCYSFT